jgi:hypothetical protein
VQDDEAKVAMGEEAAEAPSTAVPTVLTTAEMPAVLDVF